MPDAKGHGDRAAGPAAGASAGLEGGRPAFSTGVRLQSPPAVVEILRHFGVEAVSLANNHLMDFGPDGLRSTLNLLRENGMAAVGAGTDLAAARAGVVLTSNGQR